MTDAPGGPVSIETPDWVRDAVFYQIFPDRFARSGRVPTPGPFEPWDAPPTSHGFKGGDLYGIADRLGDLADLGVTAIYLTPIFASASNHRYHTYDYLNVDPLLGGNDALRELLDAAHGRGMRVVLDGVFNHSGRGFWPFHHVLENGAASPYRDWFQLDRTVLAGRRALDAYPAGGVEGHRESSAMYGYRAWWGLPALPKLNVAHPQVREYLLGVAEHWLRFGIDGWRLDVPAEIEDPIFWPAFRRRCRAVRSDAYLVGEIWSEAPEWLRGDRFDALMNYPLGAAILGFTGAHSLDRAVIATHHVYRETIRALDARSFGAELERLMTNYDPTVVAVQLNLIGSHDAPRALTVLGRDRAALRLATLLQLTLPGAPCIYYGDEIGMEGGHDPDCRRSYPSGAGAGDQELRAFVRAAAAARHGHLALRRGLASVGAAGRQAIAIVREADGARAIVALNPGNGAERLTVELRGPSWRPLSAVALPGLTGSAELVRDGGLELVLAPRQAVVLVED